MLTVNCILLKSMLVYDNYYNGNRYRLCNCGILVYH